MAQKQPNLAQNMLSWTYIGLAGSFGALLVCGCGALAVSRKTPIYFLEMVKMLQMDWDIIVHFTSFNKLRIGDYCP